jgi:hypothetical protein
LSERLTEDFEKGWSVRNLEYCRNFYLEYPVLLEDQKLNAVRSISPSHPTADHRHISNARGTEYEPEIATAIPKAPRAKSWQPGQLHPNLSWTHYRRLVRGDRTDARAFYERGHPKQLVGARTGTADQQSAL